MHITFLHPGYAWLFPASAVIAAIFGMLAWRRRNFRFTVFMPANMRIFDELRSRGHSILLNGMLWLMSAFAVLALMEPELTVSRIEPVYEHATTVAAFDISKSMSAEAGTFGLGGRLEAVKQAFLELLSAEAPSPPAGWRKIFGIYGAPKRILEGQRLGIVAFAGSAFAVMDPMTKRVTLQSAIRQLSYNQVAVQGSNLAAAIEESLAFFRKSDKVKVLILFTDGEEEENLASPIDDILSKAVLERVKIFPVVVGHLFKAGDLGAPIRVQKNGQEVEDWTKPSMAIPNKIAASTGTNGGKAIVLDEREKFYPELSRIFAEVKAASEDTVYEQEPLQSWCAWLFLGAWLAFMLLSYLKKGKKIEHSKPMQ